MKSSSTLLIIGVSTLAAFFGAPSARAADFINGNFEAGLLGWTEAGGSWFGGLNYPADYTFRIPPYQSLIVTPRNVPCLAGKGVIVDEVRSGGYSLRLNSNDGGGYNFSQIQQTVPGWNSPYFLFDWSAVLQDSGHARTARPHFRVILENVTRGTTIHNVAYYSDDPTPGMWLRTGGAADDWSYSGWRQMEINTPNMVGDTLRVTILASDCAEGAHDGALYVDNIMGRPQIPNNLPVAVPVVSPSRMPAGTPVVLDGTGSNDLESDPIILYDWDLNGDGVPDLSGASQQVWTIPVTWAPGQYTLNLRVLEQPPTPLPVQWSPWAPVTLTVLGPPVPALSTLLPATASIPANGQSTQVLTVYARDVNSNALTSGGETVVISLASGVGKISSTIDNSNGTYTATVTSPLMPGAGMFTATMRGVPVGTTSGASQSVVTYTPVVHPYLWAASTSTNTVVVWWPVSETSWRLQATTNLLTSGTNWTDCSYQTNGPTCLHIESTPTGSQFYRLTLP